MESHHPELPTKKGVPSEISNHGEAPTPLPVRDVRLVYAVGKVAARIVATYVIVAALWILISDPLLAAGLDQV